MRSDERWFSVYELVARLVHASSARRLIHIGEGPTDTLKHVGINCELIWIGAPETESVIRDQFPAAAFICANLEVQLPEDVPRDIFNDSVVVCLNVLHKLDDPAPLALQLSQIRAQCSWLIIT